MFEDEVKIYRDEGDNEHLEILTKEKCDLVNEVEEKFSNPESFDFQKLEKVPEAGNANTASQKSYLELLDGDESKIEDKFMKTLWNFCYKSIMQNTEIISGRQQPTTSEMPQFPTDTVSNPFDSNLFLSSHIQKPMLDQNKYNEIYCNPSMYGGMYIESGYTDELPMHLMASEWRQTIHQSGWDGKSESKNTIRSNGDINEQYFRKSSITNSTCSQDVGSTSDYSPLDSFPRNMNTVKGSQYYYPSISFGNAESKIMTRMNSTYSSDNSSFSSLSPKMSFDMNKSSKVLTELTSSQSDFDKIKKTHIKKPLNAFMLFMKEMRSRVVAECTLKESAAINQILGRRWHALTREEQTKYYEMARKEKELHQQLYPNWSARDNYASHTKRKKKRTNTLFQMSYFNHGNSFKSSHQNSGQKFQSDFHEQTMLDQSPLVFGNKRGLLSNHNFFYKPDSSYHIDPLLALHYNSSFSDKLTFANSPQSFNSNWSTAAVTDSLINGNKDCPSKLQIGTNLDISSERLLNNPNITNERIPDIQNPDLEIPQSCHSQKQHLVSESVF